MRKLALQSWTLITNIDSAQFYSADTLLFIPLYGYWVDSMALNPQMMFDFQGENKPNFDLSFYDTIKSFPNGVKTKGPYLYKRGTYFIYKKTNELHLIVYEGNDSCVWDDDYYNYDKLTRKEELTFSIAEFTKQKLILVRKK